MTNLKKIEITKGMLLGCIGVVCFSITPSATRAAVLELPPVLVSAGRVFIASILAILILLIARPPLPNKEQFNALARTSLGVCIGFPIFTALAYQVIPASHGAIVSAILPLVTAGMAVWKDNERPKAKFWICSVIGALSVLAFAVYEGAGALSHGDGWMFLAILAAAYGYTEGAKLTRTLGGWQTICWALVLAGPFALVATIIGLQNTVLPTTTSVWIGFAYLCVVSQLVGFFPWYKGMAIAGISKVGQLQLAQAPLGVLVSAIILGEHVNLVAIPTLAIVITTIVIANKKPSKIT